MPIIFQNHFSLRIPKVHFRPDTRCSTCVTAEHLLGVVFLPDDPRMMVLLSLIIFLETNLLSSVTESACSSMGSL